MALFLGTPLRPGFAHSPGAALWSCASFAPQRLLRHHPLSLQHLRPAWLPLCDLAACLQEFDGEMFSGEAVSYDRQGRWYHVR